MEEEAERHRTARDGLEIELQSLRERLQIVESFSDDLDSRDSSREPSSRCERPSVLFIRVLGLS